ncbi:MAG: OmpA family protein [Reyranella sp.]|nr:OmpA family protein [Reyranella sp.]
MTPLLAPLAIAALSGTARAQAPASAEDIVRKLTPSGPATRSLRGVTVTPGEKTAPPSIDLYINFEFDSAKLDSNGILALQALGTALKDPRLKGNLFQIAGHTDAVGDDAYNQRLSEARARTVRDYLIQQFGVPPEALTAVGLGKSKLLDPSRPTDAVNRRVQVTNFGI